MKLMALNFVLLDDSITAVTILTTYEAIQPCTKVKQWDQKNGQEIQVGCLSTLVTYNQNMGGVGLLDGVKLLLHSY